MFCPERRSTELKERLHRLLDLGVPCNMQNIYVDDGMTGITDFCRPDSCASFFDGLNHAKTHHFKGQNPDIICVEGLHGMSAKALVDPEFARGLLAFNTAVHRNFGASLWYSSHTKKQQRDAKGSLIENDYLGGVLIPAIMTGYYLFERLPSAGEHKSHMKQKKDTVSGLCDELVFTYDPETGLMTLDKDSPQVKAREKFRLYINSCFQAGNTFTHADLMKISAVSQSTVSREIGLRIKEGVLVNTGKAGCNGIYKPLALI
jgi:hypothetical protein